MEQMVIFLLMSLALMSGLNHNEASTARVSRVGSSVRLLERERRNKRQTSGIIIRWERHNHVR